MNIEELVEYSTHCGYLEEHRHVALIGRPDTNVARHAAPTE